MAHVLAFLYPILRVIINIIIAIVNGIIRTICLIVAVFSSKLTKEDCKEKGMTPLPKENPFKNIALPMLSYPDCEACECKTQVTDNSSDELSSAEEFESDLGFGVMFDATIIDNYVATTANNYCSTDLHPGYGNTYMFDVQNRMLCSGYDSTENDTYKNLLKENDNNITTNSGHDDDRKEWYKSPCYPHYKDYEDGIDGTANGFDIRWNFQPNPTWAQSLNLMNRRHMYFGDEMVDNGVGTGYFSPVNSMSNNTNKNKTTNRIQVECINDQFPNPASVPWTDMCNIFVFDPGTTIESGSLMTFNDVTQVADPNVAAYAGTNSFGNQSITGTTNGNPNGYVQTPVTYIDYEGNAQTGAASLVVTGTTSYYKMKSGIEYFQVLTAMTLSEIGAKVNAGESFGLLERFVRDYRGQYTCKHTGTIANCNSCSGINKITQRADDWENIVVGFFVRGVDVHTPRQKMKYDLSKLFGWGVGNATDWNEQVVVTGDYYMNIPIQPNGGSNNGANDGWRVDKYTPVPHYEWRDNKLEFHDNYNNGTSSGGNWNGTPMSPLFHSSYTFTPNPDDWESFDTYSFNKYCSMDKQISQDNRYENYMGNNEDCWHDVSAPEFPDAGINPWMQRGIEGCGYQYTRLNNANNNLNNEDAERRLDGAGKSLDIVSVSPLYLPREFEVNSDGTYPGGVPKTVMNNSSNIVFRSDRLPSSDKFELLDSDKPEFRRYTLHMNNVQTIFFIDDEGVVTTPDGDIVGTSDSSGNAQDDLEDANSTTAQVIESFSCGGMVPLGCYEGSGEDFAIEDPCDLHDNGNWFGYERVVNGCYMFVVKRVLISIPRDIQMFFEWRTRIRFMFALCQGVIGEMFQNNWLNGTLYMPAFQKQTLYNSDNQPRRYRYCGDPQQFWDGRKDQGPVYFNTETNSFFYRSTPFNDNTNQFIGQEPGRSYYTGQNKLNIWSPTTIMELGPRDEFTREISFSPEFEGYFIDTLTSTSYKDISTIINLFAISRLSNANFLEQLLSAGDASVGAIFSREFDALDGTALADFISNPFDARVDGDFAQMVSINSEYGVVPYLEGNYEDSITVEDDRFGIWFSSNTVNRRVVTDGTTTFGTNVTGPTNLFGYPNSQVIPYYMWTVKDNGLFGTEQNTWQTEYIFSSVYQGDDFYNGVGKYMKPDGGYGYGHIYNKISSDPEYDSHPVNNPNSNNFKVGNPFQFYFGLRRGKTAMNRYIKKYIFNLE